MARNANLTAAKKAKNDEFYTQLTDIEKELAHYHDQLRDKIIFCNCDDPEWSNFWRYFDLNFDFIGIKALIATHYDPEKPTYKLEIRRNPVTGVKLPPVRTDLKQNGDFRSPECVELLKECDVVVTNPPFSLFREYVAQHQQDATALELWSYFRSVIDWVDSLFGVNYRKKLMKGLPWGEYYNSFVLGQKESYNPIDLEARLSELLQDEDITNQKGLYEFLLGGETEDRLLHIRAFSEKDKRRKYEEQGGVCAHCGEHVEYEACEADHVTPWSQGGHTEYGNLQVLCRKCNRSKIDK